MADSTKRFSIRARHYAQYRPCYPQDVLAALRDECGLTAESKIADIGSGTGLLAEMFLRNGNTVFAVEPNPEMRNSGEKLLEKYPGFRSIDGRAEETALPDGIVHFIISGQAFHWFDPENCRKEFSRILRPNGTVMIVWNERDTRVTPFMVEYEALLLRHVPNYPEINYRKVYEESVAEFFEPFGFRSRTFRYRQQLDHDGTTGRLLSSSYTPYVGHPNYIPMLEALSAIFYNH